MSWPSTSLILEATLELGADLTADPSGYAFATDFTTKTFDRNGNSSIVIQRGRQDETTQTGPSSIDLTVKNNDGRFTSRNPVGAYYPNLRRNTPLRVRVNPGTGLTTRGVGFLSELPARWDVAEVDFHVPIKADGILRRLGQGATPLKSAMRRRILSPDEPTPIAYWPCEDGSDATAVASGLTGGSSLTGATPRFASGIAGSAGALDLVAMGTSTVSATVSLPSSSGVQLEFTALSDIGSIVVMIGLIFHGPTLAWSSPVGLTADVADGQPHHIAYRFVQSGADVVRTKYHDGVLAATDTLTNLEVGSAITLVTPGSVIASGTALLSHITVYGFSSMEVPTSRAPAADGYTGEISGDRFVRLCTEEGIPADVTAGSTEAMGPQLPKTLLELLRECESAEEGLIVERRTGELGFDPHSVRENQTVALTLNYATGKVSPPLDPTDDDQRTRNDITATREGGSSAFAIDEDGPVGITAVGRVDEGVTLNLYTDDQVAHHASWRLNLGTVDELRFPTVTVNLRRNSDLVAAWLALDIGSRIKITNLPDHISYDDVDLIVEGYTEQISQKNWIVTFNCAPYKPYKIFELSDTASDASEFVGRLAGEDDAALRIAVDDNDTSFPFDPNYWRWTTVADDFDPDLRVRLGGETADVSTIATTAATFVATGTAVGADNAAVTPGLPAGVTANDWLFVFAATRGAGTLSINNSYTRLPVFGATDNVQLFGKIHTGSESAPTVTPSGGSAGDTMTAQMCAFRSMPITRGMSSAIADARSQLNGSAANVAYPACYPYPYEGCIVLVLGWKQNLWTSVATLSGFTEIGDVASVDGNDQSLGWDYQIQTTPPTLVDAGSFVVTGGGNAISRGAVVAFVGGFQTMTISARSVNGVVKSHAVGALVAVDNPLVLGL